MDNKLQDYLETFRGKRVTVLGIGVSNTPLIRLLAGVDAKITACDKMSREDLGALATEFDTLGVTLRLGRIIWRGFLTQTLSFALPVFVRMCRRSRILSSAERSSPARWRLFYLSAPVPSSASRGVTAKRLRLRLSQSFWRRLGIPFGSGAISDVPSSVKCPI